MRRCILALSIEHTFLQADTHLQPVPHMKQNSVYLEILGRGTTERGGRGLKRSGGDFDIHPDISSRHASKPKQRRAKQQRSANAVVGDTVDGADADGFGADAARDANGDDEDEDDAFDIEGSDKHSGSDAEAAEGESIAVIGEVSEQGDNGGEHDHSDSDSDSSSSSSSTDDSDSDGDDDDEPNADLEDDTPIMQPCDCATCDYVTSCDWRGEGRA